MRNILLIVLSLSLIWVRAQAKLDANVMMEKAFGPVGNEDAYAIKFESVAFGLKVPQQIFSLPSYSYHKGGYFYYSKGKYEINLGVMKAISNGKLSVMIDESAGQMVVDSVREINDTTGFHQSEKFAAMLGKSTYSYGEGRFVSNGEETLNGVLCYKVKTKFDNNGPESQYWINKSTGILYMFADKNEQGLFDVYLVKSLGKPPVGYVYDVKIPKNELTNLYGYEVLDLRYVKGE